MAGVRFLMTRRTGNTWKNAVFSMWKTCTGHYTFKKAPEEESGCYALYAGIQECSFALAKLGRNNIHKKQAQTTDKASKHAVSRELQLVFSS
jgi:hypothetical protein